MKEEQERRGSVKSPILMLIQEAVESGTFPPLPHVGAGGISVNVPGAQREPQLRYSVLHFGASPKCLSAWLEAVQQGPLRSATTRSFLKH